MKAKFKDLRPSKKENFNEFVKGVTSSSLPKSQQGSNSEVELYADDFADGNEKTTVIIPSSTFVDLVKLAKPLAPPLPVVVDSFSLVGEASKEHAIFSTEIIITSLSKYWSYIKLIPGTVSIFESEVRVISHGHELGRNQQQQHEEGKADGYSEEEDNSSDAYLAVRDDYHCIVVQGLCTLRVMLRFFVPYLSEQGRALRLNIPKAMQKSLSFTVKDIEMQISVQNSINVKTEYIQGMNSFTCSLPPISNLEIFWTEMLLEDIELKEETQTSGITTELDSKKIIVETVVASNQSIVVSIGEGVMTVFATFDYKIHHGSRSVFLIDILDPRFHLLSVDGRGIKKWDVLQGKERGIGRAMSSLSNTTTRDDVSVISSLSSESVRTLRVLLDTGVEDEYHITLTGEIELGNTSCQTTVSTFSTRSVKKEKGYVAISAVTSIELLELHSFGMTRVDSRDLKPSMATQASASGPIILSYKFLSPNYDILLDVKRHADSAVLSCIVDSAWYTVTYANAVVLHNCLFQVKNTTKQYFRLKLPSFIPPLSTMFDDNDDDDIEVKDEEKSLQHEQQQISPSPVSIWTSSVNGIPVKPAFDQEGWILVPIHRSNKSKNDKSSSSVSNLEFVFIQRVDELKGSGKINFEFASCDVPINHLIVNLYMPSELNISEFEGDLTEKKGYMLKTRPNVSISTRDDETTVNYRANLMQQQQVQAPMERRMRKKGGFTSSSSSSSNKRSLKSSGLVSGALPVQIDHLEIGKKYSFERLLVTADTDLALRSSFVETSKGYFSKRKLPGLCPCCSIL